MPEKYVAVKLSRPNDIYGNPRRLYVVYKLHEGETKFGERVDVIEEGYRGTAALFEKYRDAILLAEYMVDAETYRVYKKMCHR